MNADRRTQPRNTTPACPHCDSTRTGDHHYRDAGDLSPEDAIRHGYCPTLAAKRTRTTGALTLAPSDARLAARMDLAPDLDPAELAELYARAIASTT